MGLREDIQKKVKDIIDNDVAITEIEYIPKLDDPKLTFGNTGLKFKGTVLYIDMRGSTKILNNHQKKTVAKLHMAFFHAIVKIANSLNGNVRSFNGDSALIFFQGDTKGVIKDAVKCGMQIKFMLSQDQGGIVQQLKKYSEIDFGIGIDHGEIICTKVGAGGEHNRDLFWIGNAVNKSASLGDSSEGPHHLSISKFVYDNLLDEVKFGQKLNIFQEKIKTDMWSRDTFDYNDSSEYYYSSSWFWKVY